MNVFRVGEYKSFVEPFTRDSMSAADKEASQRWLSGLWDAYRDDVAVARDLDPGEITGYVDQFADRVEAAQGNLAQVALEAGLVDELAVRGALDEYLLSLVGEGDDGYSRIDYRNYLSALRREREQEPTGNRIGLLVASGQIVDGKAPPGTIGGDSLATMIRQATEDPELGALVLQVDSPGGSMFASEVIYQELLAWKNTERPLMVSMSGVAASGGYYIAMPADKIFASPTTITGSIGVGALVPTFQRGLARLGVRVDGIGTTALAGQFSPERELGPDARRVLQASVDDAYRIFVGKVADSREMTFERADNLARGRVWIGADALAAGLVDETGQLDEALDAAAEAAGFAADDYSVEIVERQMSLREQLASSFAIRVGKLVHWLGLSSLWQRDAGVHALLQLVEDQADLLMRFNDPRGLYLHCFCISD